MNIMKFTVTAAATILLATAAWAMSLQTAKQQNLVGEKTSGYIGAVVNSAEVNALVSSINAQRKQAYMSISQENQQSLKVVETLAAKKLYNKLSSGDYYQSADGSWKQK